MFSVCVNTKFMKETIQLSGKETAEVAQQGKEEMSNIFSLPTLLTLDSKVQDIKLWLNIICTLHTTLWQMNRCV